MASTIVEGTIADTTGDRSPTPDHDLATFLRPIAHRGLHGAPGIVENAAAAFEAACALDLAIECDVQPSADGHPMVFHDDTLDRLTRESGAISARPTRQLSRIAYRDGTDTILQLEDLFTLVGGRVPLIVEIKSGWRPLDPAYLARICDAVRSCHGPVALKSFDPEVMAAIRRIAPGIPRGIVAGGAQVYEWWGDALPPHRHADLADLLETRAAAPQFISYHVRDLDRPIVRYVREVLGLPVMTWTVRTPQDLALATRGADAAVFEQIAPETVRAAVAAP